MFNNDNNINLGIPARHSGCMRGVNRYTVRENKDHQHSREDDSRSSVGYGLNGFSLASVYAPVQNFTNIYDCETGLSKGTIFSELDLPFVCGGMNGGNNRG